jgi:phospholipid/cholesterol/gamma-HCH transport system substrate-binding protein
MSKIDSALGAINNIMNPTLQKNIDRSFASIANSLQTLEGTTKKVDALVGAQSSHIDAIMNNAETVSGNLKTSTSHFNGIATNFEKFSADLSNSNIKQTLDNTNKAVDNLQQTLSKVNSTDGSLGLLINDKKMYNNLNDASNNLNNLFIDIKAHPSRYVSFSVFGGKKGN